MSSPSRYTRTVRYPEALWTSFDRYSRYGATAAALEAHLPSSASVLDVGDPSGYLSLFAPQFELTCADLNTDQPPLDGTVRLLASGGQLPFADGAFDAVITNDALEHVPAEVRPSFLTELTRVASKLVVVAAPFDTVGVFGAEEYIRRFAFVALGRPQEQLEEHAERGLPDLDGTVAFLAELGTNVASFGNGNLEDWLFSMLLKHQNLNRPELAPLDQGADMLYSAMYEQRNNLGPFYRHVVVASKDGDAQIPESCQPVALDTLSSAAVTSPFAALLAAGAAEATRADLATREASFSVLHERLDNDFSTVFGTLGVGAVPLSERVGQLEQRIDGLVTSVERMETVLGKVLETARHPISTITRRVRGADSGD